MVNSSVVKIYVLILDRDQLRKMQLQGLRLGIEPVVLKCISSRHSNLPSLTLNFIY